MGLAASRAARRGMRQGRLAAGLRRVPRHRRRAVRDGRAPRELAVAGPDRLPARRRLPGRREGQQGRHAAARRRRSPAIPGERATVVGRFQVADAANFVTVTEPRPRRAQRGQPAEPDDQRRQRHVRATTTSRTTTRRSASSSAATRYGRARGTVIERNRIHNCGELPADEPPPRDLRGGLRRRADHRQLDLRQRRPRGAAVPGRAGHLRRAQRDRRQRAGR